MAFPWLFSEGFEAGTRGGFNSETDTNSKLDFAHYPLVAQITSRGGYSDVPYSGAYAAHVDLSLGTADAFVQEDDGWDTAADGTVVATRFYLYVTSDLTMAASDRFTIFTLQSAGNTDEAVVDIRNNAGTIEILASETNASATVRAATLTLGAWHLIELVTTVDVGAAGAIDFYLDGSQVGTQIGSLTHAAIAQARLGTMNIDAGTTVGHLFFDDVIADDARINGVQERFPSYTRWVTYNQHAILGPGKAEITATSSSTDLAITLYDTDDANTGVTAQPLRVIRTSSDETSVEESVEFGKGLYVEVAGTNPQVFVDVLRGKNMSRASTVNWALGA